MRTRWIAATALLLAGCGADELAAPVNEGGPANAAVETHSADPAAPAEAAQQAMKWSFEAVAGGGSLRLASGAGDPAIGLRCTASTLMVEVPSFRTIGSEDRLSFGSGGEVVALVAAIKERKQSGVSAAGAMPENLAGLIAGPVSASYGAQKSGPHPAPPPELARAFIAACAGKAGPKAKQQPPAPAGGANAPQACMTQGEERLRLSPLRAVGTEPFWGARIVGRCVTYNHPEDQKGTRIWTRYTPGPDGGTWSGALGGKKFELRTRSAPGCSDGMSDERYPFAVELLVGGERRKGCAEPL
ncbi:MAG TPA: hypothetical protein VIT45_02040 [Allosphingosinicella sp.]